MNQPAKEHQTMRAEANGDLEARSAILYICGPVPEWPSGLNSAAAFNRMQKAYREEAKRCVDLFMRHMPGGLVDAIFAELAERKASVFIVPHEDPEPERTPRE